MWYLCVNTEPHENAVVAGGKNKDYLYCLTHKTARPAMVSDLLATAWNNSCSLCFEGERAFIFLVEASKS